MIKVLLIEDNLADTRLIRELLEEDEGIGFKIIHVTELEVGLGSLRHGDIDLVLLDLALPDSQGMDTFTRVYALAPHVPIVVLTGVKDDALALELIRAGAQDFLVKGMINYCVLRQTVRYAIERARGTSRGFGEIRLGEVDVASGTGSGEVLVEPGDIPRQPLIGDLAIEGGQPVGSV